MYARSWLMMLPLLLCACGDGGASVDAGGNDSDTGSMRATISGQVLYAGDADGSLLVGVFPWDEENPSMPMGPPSDFVPADEPSFPFDYELSGLRPGSYFVGAVLDVGRDDPTIPGEEDLEHYSGRIDLEAGDSTVVDLELMD